MPTPQDLVKRYARGLTTRSPYEPEWRDIARYVLPRKSNVLLSQMPGHRQTTVLYDSTAIKANEDLSSAMQGSLTSSAIRWFTLKMRAKPLNDSKRVKVWLEECADRIHLAFQQSNFSAEFHEVYLDLGAFGVSCVLLEENDPTQKLFNGFLFRTLTIGEYVIEEDFTGRVNALYRQFQVSHQAAADRWGPEKLSERAREVLAKKPEEMLTIMQAVVPRPDGQSGPKVPAREKRWANHYVEVGLVNVTTAPPSFHHQIEESGYDEFPFMVPRWTKSGSELYGRGPGHTAIPDVRTLNRSVELTFKQWAKAIDPSVEVLDGALVSELNLTPAAQNYVSQMGSIKPIESGARFDVDKVKADELRERIRNIFFSDKLNLPPMQGTPVSATEIRIRFELMERLLGPTLGRLESELLNPLIDRAFQIMSRTGALPNPPPEVVEAARTGQGGLDIEYEGPLARSQKQSDIEAIERATVILTPLQAVFPDIMDNVDGDKTARHVLDILGFPAKAVRDEAEVAALRDERANEAEERTETEQGMAAAEMLQKGGAGIKAVTEAAANGGQPGQGNRGL